MSDPSDRFEMKKGWFLVSTAGSSLSGDRMRDLADYFVAEAEKAVAHEQAAVVGETKSEEK